MFSRGMLGGFEFRGVIAGGQNRGVDGSKLNKYQGGYLYTAQKKIPPDLFSPTGSTFLIPRGGAGGLEVTEVKRAGQIFFQMGGLFCWSSCQVRVL